MLVLRGLELMRSLSPQYLQRFVGYVDTLALLEGLTPAQVTPKKATPRKKKSA
jgi:allophanate hydrolase subunit 1